jgi:hypothetical protein
VKIKKGKLKLVKEKIIESKNMWAKARILLMQISALKGGVS